MSKDLGFDHAILSEYSKHGIYGRVRTVQLLESAIYNQLESPDKITEDLEHALNTNQLISTLQVVLVSQLMMFLEDVAVFCISFMNKDWKYYQLLDTKTAEGDLGNTIGRFFQRIESLTDEELRQIMSYIDPDKYDFENDIQKNHLISVMEKNFKNTRKFFKKIAVFGNNHHEIFRRYKHAGFPFFLGMKIPNSDVSYKQFDFVTAALVSKLDPSKEAMTIPFSKNVLISYENLNKDIFLFLSSILVNKLICIERNVHTIPPSYIDHFNKKYSKEEIDTLKALWASFEKKYPLPEGHYEDGANMQAAWPFWYVYLDEYSKPCFE